jgi:hypothetical protein
VDLVFDSTLVKELLLVDGHEGVTVDAGVQHVVRVHGILLTERLKTERNVQVRTQKKRNTVLGQFKGTFI